MPVQGRTALPVMGSALPVILLAYFMFFAAPAWAGSPIPTVATWTEPPKRGTFNVVPATVTAKPTVQTVNINTATVESLAQVLVGVGPAKAQAIVAYRKQYGAFKSVDELLEVKGIGKSLLEKNRGRILLR
jgi:competence protein ComEA